MKAKSLAMTKSIRRPTSIMTILLICLVSLINNVLHAQNEDPDCVPVSLSPANSQLSLNTSLYYFEDKENTITFKDLSNPDVSGRFKLNSKRKLNFGYTSSAYWVKFCVRNIQPENNDWLLEIDYIPLDSITIYTINRENKVTVRHFGDMYPFGQREMEFRTYILPLDFSDTLMQPNYIRIKTQGSMQFPFSLLVFHYAFAAFKQLPCTTIALALPLYLSLNNKSLVRNENFRAEIIHTGIPVKPLYHIL